MNETPKPQPVARAIDAGFGMMKFTRARADGGIAFAAFPSVVMPTRVKPGVDLPTTGAQQDTILVQYEGHTYSVGPDVRYELGGSDFGREMSDAYYQSSVYHALMRGALAMMGESTIDTLVLGLPMDRFDHPALIQNLETHYSGRVDLGFGRSVDIRKVVVHPQPFGGYIGLGRHIAGINKTLAAYPHAGIDPLKNPDDIRSLNVLVVDSGAYTLDWLFMSPKGPVRSACGAANNAGRHRVVRRLFDAVSDELGRKPPISFLFDIDDAERNKRPLRIDGRIFDFGSEKYQMLVKEAIDDNVQQMIEHIGSNMDRVDLIAVVGGETRHITNCIKMRRPNIPVFTPADSTGGPESIYCNLSGFQEYAQALATQSQ